MPAENIEPINHRLAIINAKTQARPYSDEMLRSGMLMLWLRRKTFTTESGISVEAFANTLEAIVFSVYLDLLQERHGEDYAEQFMQVLENR